MYYVQSRSGNPKQLSSLKQYDDVSILQNEIRKSYKNYMIGVIAFSFCMIVILVAFLYFGTKNP